MRKVHFIPAILLILIAVASHPMAARAETAAVGGPMLGYVADPAGGVRAILGVPGAAVVGERRPLGMDAALVEVSPAQDYALTVDGEGAVARVELGRETPAARAVEGAMRSPERIVMSPGGRAALLLRGAEAQVIGGAAVTTAIDLSPAGPLAALAVSDRGDVLAAGRESLYLFSKGEARLLPAAGRVTALAFGADGRGALAAGPGQVAVIDDVAGSASWRVLATLEEQVGAPVAIAEANGRVVVATSSAVLLIGPDGSANKFQAEATTLSKLQGHAFRLSAYSEGPMWMIEVGSEPRLLFIPPAAENEEVAQ